MFFSKVNFLPCWLLFRHLFHSHVTAKARTKSWSFCQKCRWLVTAKHTCTLRIWLRMNWYCQLVHGCMMYTEPARDGSSFNDSAVKTPLGWIFKGRYRKSLIGNRTRQGRSKSRVMEVLDLPLSSEIWNLRYTGWEQRKFETCVTRDKNRESLKPALHELRTETVWNLRYTR